MIRSGLRKGTMYIYGVHNFYFCQPIDSLKNFIIVLVQSGFLDTSLGNGHYPCISKE